LFDFPADLPPGASHGAELGYLPGWRRYRPTAADRYVQELGPNRTGRYDRSGKHQLRFWKELG
jgi:hypothetical protein